MLSILSVKTMGWFLHRSCSLPAVHGPLGSPRPVLIQQLAQTRRSEEIQMKINQWTLGLIAVGAVSVPSVLLAEESLTPVLTALSSTTISGYIDTSAIWKFGTGNANMPGRVYDIARKQD